MHVLIRGQEKNWVNQLIKLCKRDEIYFLEREIENQSIQLVVTDFPVEYTGKGTFSEVPFLVISRENREEKILEAFARGAEDYMIFPVSPEIARVRILRILEHQKNGMNLLPEKLHLTPNEYRLFSYMMKYPGKVFSRNELIEGAFPENYEGYDRYVDNYVKQIRKKLEEKMEGQAQIETVYGVGYRFMPKKKS